MKYDYQYNWDANYCYPNSNVLKNKFGITDADKLQIADREVSSLNIATARIYGIPGNFDLKHLQRIHKYLFNEIYAWAGQIRTVDISKGNAFCHSAYIKENTDKVFAQLKNENYLKNTPADKIPERLSYYLSEINAIHPFLEGNGRAQRMFVELLAKELGYFLDFSKLNSQEMVEASAEAFCCRYEKMNALIEKIIVPLAAIEYDKKIERETER